MTAFKATRTVVGPPQAHPCDEPPLAASSAPSAPSATVSSLARRILVIEDDPTLRDSLRMLLGGAEFDVRVLPDGRRIDRTLADFRPDLAVLDVDLGAGNANGFVLARHLQETGRVAIIFLTAADGLDDRLNGFEVGADDYITKPFSVSELQARIRAVLRRTDSPHTGTTERRMLTFADIVLDEDSRTVCRADTPLELTRREFDLLLALLEHEQRVLSRSQLLTLVWGFEDYDANVVEVYVSSLRRKLEEHGPRVIQTVRGVGYVLRS
jgi:two-component system OmpR family response regulator